MDTVYLVLCAACARSYLLPYPRKQRRTSSGSWMEPEPWFCQRKPCQEALKAREEREARQARIGSAHRPPVD